MMKALDIADAIVKESIKQGMPANHTRLQKLLFFTWIAYYEKNAKYLFQEDFLAWPFGPAIREVYWEYCYSGFADILSARPQNNTVDALSDNIQGIIANVINKFRSMSTDVLVELSHEAGGSWRRAYQNEDDRDQLIPHQDIVKFDCNKTSRN